MPDGALIESESPALSRSLWNATANTFPETPPLSGPAETDIAVVGAGFAGLSTALHLAEAGHAVTVLEARTPGWGASGRNGGQVIAGLKEDPDTILATFGKDLGSRFTRLSGDAPDIVYDIIRRYGIDCGATQLGWIQPAQNAAAQKVQQERVRQWAPWSDKLDLVDAARVRDMLGGGDYHSAMIDYRSGGVQPLNYALGLAAAAQSQGAVIHGHSPVTALARDGAGWLLTTPGGTLRARVVVLATNGYSGPVQETLRRSVVPVVSAQVATAPLPEEIRTAILPEGQLASDMYKLLIYFRMDGEGRFVMGGRGAYSDGAMPARFETLKQKSIQLYPQLADVEWPYHWGGFVAMTADHLPHMHEIEPGLIAGVGFNGRGVAMATAAGRELAKKAAGTAEAGIDMPVTPLRAIPFHFLRKPVVTAVATWYGIKDRFGLT